MEATTTEKEIPHISFFHHHPCGAIPYHSSFFHPTLGGRSLWINNGCWGGISTKLTPAAAAAAWSKKKNDEGVKVAASSIRGILIEDVEPEGGPRVILPFLTTQDRLRLSECSTWLLRYRSCLSQLKLTHHTGGSITAELENGLIGLVAQQSCLSSLSVCHQLGLRWVVQSGGCGGSLRVLDVSCVAIKDESLGVALAQGHYPHLEELKLSCSTGVTLAGLGKVMRALADGACPRLTRLQLIGGSMLGVRFIDHLSAALQSWTISSLEELELHNVRIKSKGMRAIAEALQQGVGRYIRRLILTDCDVGNVGAVALGQALGSGSLLRLEVLDLSTNPMKDEGMLALADAIACGWCPRLRRLELYSVAMGPSGGRALAHALSTGGSAVLEYLSIGDNDVGDEAVAEIIRALSGGHHQLKHLDVSLTGMLGAEGGKALATALKEGSWQDLRVLRMSQNNLVGVDVAGALEGVSRLEELDVDGTDLGPHGMERLAEVLENDGVCPLLVTLWVGGGEAPAASSPHTVDWRQVLAGRVTWVKVNGK